MHYSHAIGAFKSPENIFSPSASNYEQSTSKRTRNLFPKSEQFFFFPVKFYLFCVCYFLKCSRALMLQIVTMFIWKLGWGILGRILFLKIQYKKLSIIGQICHAAVIITWEVDLLFFLNGIHPHTHFIWYLVTKTKYPKTGYKHSFEIILLSLTYFLPVRHHQPALKYSTKLHVDTYPVLTQMFKMSSCTVE